MKRFISVLLFLFLALPAFAQPKNHLYSEKDYQTAWSVTNGGSMEVILPDKARVDCVTKTHAIEFDFAQKWGEAIGQALYYGTALHKKPGIVLIMENPAKDQKYLKRVMAVANQHGITVWTITPSYVTKFKRVSLVE